MSKRILVTGAKGQLGSEIKELSNNYDFDFFFTDVEQLDITDKVAITNFVIENRINNIVNCAAYTAVDKAETEKDLADLINHKAVRNLAEIASKEDIALVHISTDYVFDGNGFKPYTTDHPKSPVNHYGKTKLDGEKAILGFNLKNSFIIRTSWVYSSFGNNFVKTMLRLGEEKTELNVINDQVGVPTYAADLALFILDHLLEAENEHLEIYHYTNEGVCSWYDFAQAIMDLGNRSCKVNAVPTSAYPTPAKRPFYSLMDKESLKQRFAVEIPYWKESLIQCVEKLKKAPTN